MTHQPDLDAALASACEAYGLSPIYQDCVRPLLTMPARQWPPCCGRDCEPCSVTLAAIAREVQARLAKAAGE